MSSWSAHPFPRRAGVYFWYRDVITIDRTAVGNPVPATTMGGPRVAYCRQCRSIVDGPKQHGDVMKCAPCQKHPLQCTCIPVNPGAWSLTRLHGT